MYEAVPATTLIATLPRTYPPVDRRKFAPMRSAQRRSSPIRPSRNVFHARGPSMSSITIMVRMVTIAPTLDAALLNRLDDLRPPAEHEVRHLLRPDAGDVAQDVEPRLQEVQTAAGAEEAVEESRQVADEVVGLEDERVGDGEHGADEERDRGDGHEQRGEHTVPAVALQPGHARFERHRQDQADQQPEQDRADLEEERESAGDGEHRQRDDGRCARRSVTIPIGAPRHCRVMRASGPPILASSGVSVTSACGVTLSSHCGTAVWTRPWRQHRPRRRMSRHPPDGMKRRADVRSASGGPHRSEPSVATGGARRAA